MRITNAEELRLLPDGAEHVVPGRAEPILWLRAYLDPHPDPETGLWRLPVNPFAEYHVTEIEVRLPERTDAETGPRPLRGDEVWLSTLTDPHDTSR